MSIKLNINIPNVDGDIVISVRAAKLLHPTIKQEAIISNVTSSAAYKQYSTFFNKVTVDDGIIIPGLKSNMVPQGMCKSGNYIYVSAYDSTKKEYSCIYVINAASKNLEKTLWIKGNYNHVGGLATDGTYSYITCSPNIAVISLATLNSTASGQDITPTFLAVKNASGSTFTCSFATYDTGRNLLWVGTFNKTKSDYVYAFKTNGTKSLTLKGKMSVPAKTQGLAFTGDYVYFSTSYGRNTGSNINYCKVTKGSTTKSVTSYSYTKQSTILAPPTSENIFIENNKLYILFENAASYFYNDTSNPCKYPVDRIFAYTLSSSSSTLKDFPYADQLIEIAMSYYRNADNEYVSGKSWSQGTVYRASSTPVSLYCDANMDVKNSFWVAKSGKHYKAIDCSTLVGMSLRGYKYEEGPYASKAKFNAFRKNRNQTNPSVPWAFAVPRTAAEIGEYCLNKGWIVPINSIGSASDNFSGLKKGDIIFWAKKKSNGTYKEPDRFMKISHVGLVYGNSSTFDNRLAIIESTNVTAKNHTLSNGSTLNCGVRIKDLANNKSSEVVLVARIQV